MYWKQEREKVETLFEMKEQEFMDRIRKTRKNNLFTDVGIRERRREVLAIDQMRESEAVHVDEDPQEQRIDITVPAKGSPNQKEGERAEGTNDE